MMKRKGLLDEEGKVRANEKGKKDKPNKRKLQDGQGKPKENYSETTIYQEAVLAADNQHDKININIDEDISFRLPNNNRDSSSSDDQDQIDTSNELLDVDKFIADC